MSAKNEINIFSDGRALAQAAAENFYRQARLALESQPYFNVALSGGNTPKVFFDVLAQTDSYRTQIPWEQINFFFTDERYVPADSQESNYHTAQVHLFSKVPLPAKNIFRMPTEYPDPEEAAKTYALILKKFFMLKDNALPKFDLIYLGLGEDAHTASLMPLTKIVEQYVQPESDVQNNLNDPLVVSLWVASLDKVRITLTPVVLNHAADIIFLVSGEDKAAAVVNVIEGAYSPLRYPAQLIQGNSRQTRWYLDQTAAQKLSHF